ncbi:hypothetical protein ACVIGB_000118 [Bradyrhizobium sp. USDA 4341]
MTDRTIILRREFLLRDGDGKNVDVVAELRSLGGQTPCFSITCQNGSAHELIASAAPVDIKAEIETLIQVHLCEISGVPVHAVENATYWLSSAKFDAAAKTLHDVIPVEDLYMMFGECTRRAEDPATLKDYLDRVTPQAGVAARAIERQAAGSNPGMRFRSTSEAVAKVAGLLSRRSATDAEIAQWAKGKYSDEVKSQLLGALRRGVFRTAVSALVADRCMPVWAERAEKAKAILAKPNYRVEGRPTIEADPTTFTGFAAKHGLELAALLNKRPEGSVAGKYRWDCWLTGLAFRKVDEQEKSLHALVLPFSSPVGSEPTLEMILEHMQMEFSDVTIYSCDEFLDTFEYTGSAKLMRKGQDAYRSIQDWLVRFKAILGGDEIDAETGLTKGESAFREFATSVGDNPPLTMDHFGQQATSGAAPAP